jgi:hypothetical protein
MDANNVQPQANSPASPNGQTTPLSRVVYTNLWNGINLAYTPTAGGIFMTTYTLAPGADPGAIRLRYNTPLSLNIDGTLTITFETGTMTESTPIAWQEIDGQRISVPVAFHLQPFDKLRASPSTTLGFTLGHYDPHYPLTIDPALSWNTFLGGEGMDNGNAIIVDEVGNVFVTGFTGASWGSPVRAYTSGNGFDIFIAKLDSSGSLVWNTFLGGSGNDLGQGIALDDVGNVVVTGGSNITWGSPIQEYIGGSDAFAAKLDASGNLLWNTFLGGNGDEGGNTIATDEAGNIFVAGASLADWGSPVRAYTGASDAFIAKLDSSGNLAWHTFLGDGNYDSGIGVITMDGNGSVFVTGTSDAPDSNFDAFAAKLDSSGILLWQTFLGGEGLDTGNAITLDGDGNVFVTGLSNASWGSPVRAYDSGYDVFAAKLNSSGSLVWNTFLGGSQYHNIQAIAVDQDGNMTVSSAPEFTYNLSNDAFTATLDSSGNRTWNAFFELNEDTQNHAIAMDGDGNIFVTGYGYISWGDPVQAHSAGADAFVSKFSFLIPTVTIHQASGQSDPTSATSINFTVTFSQPVSDFDDSGDVTLSGTAGATTATITGGPTSYNVAVSGMTGSGTVIAEIPAGAASDGLYLNAASTSSDNSVTYNLSTPTATITATPTVTPTAAFTLTPTQTPTLTETITITSTVTATGTPTPTATIIPVTPISTHTPTRTIITLTLRSVGAQDGWVLESSENSNMGGSLNSTANSILLGDSTNKQQYRGVLSFQTGSLPDNAVITGITLKFKKMTIAGGSNPVNIFQGFMVDIQKGTFGTASLQISDFQAAPSKTYGPFLITPVNGWYNINLSGAQTYINKLSTASGITQFRLRFKLDDNNNAIANNLSLFSGNATIADRPQLVITYAIP